MKDRRSIAAAQAAVGIFRHAIEGDERGGGGGDLETDVCKYLEKTLG